MSKPLLKQFKARKNYRCDNCGLRIWAKSLYMRVSTRFLTYQFKAGVVTNKKKVTWENHKVCETCSKSKGLWPGADSE